MTGHTISVDLKRAAVRLTRAFPVAMVSVLLDISEDTIRRAMANCEETGDVVRADGGATRGRKRLLSEDDHRVSESCVCLLPSPN
jgi:DeoR/GlpR family transcriptional regulator of sugar metabolism